MIGRSAAIPVLKHAAVAAVGHELQGELCHSRIEVVHDHQHDGIRMLILRRIVIDRVRTHGVGAWTQAIHVDVVVEVQLGKEFGSEHRVRLGWKVSEGILECQADGG